MHFEVEREGFGRLEEAWSEDPWHAVVVKWKYPTSAAGTESD